MLKVSAVPPRRSAVLTVVGGATAINDGTTAEPRRSWGCHCGLCRTSTAVAPRIRCDGGITLYPTAPLYNNNIIIIFDTVLRQKRIFKREIYLIQQCCHIATLARAYKALPGPV